MARLPAPTKNAAENGSAAASIVGAVVDTFLPKWAPIGTVISELLKNKIQKQTRESQELILEQLREGDFSTLSDDARDELIPIAFKMMQASIEGMSKAKLSLLAKLIGGAIGDSNAAGIFDSVSERLRRISNLDIEYISIVYQIHKEDKTIKHSIDGQKVEYIFGRLIFKETKRPYVEVLQALTNLNSVGFIIQKSEVTFDMTEIGYYLGRDFFSLCNFALSDQ